MKEGILLMLASIGFHYHVVKRFVPVLGLGVGDDERNFLGDHLLRFEYSPHTATDLESQKKHLDSPQNSMKELKASEVIKILENYKEAKIGFGAGYNLETSIMRVVYDFPFLSAGLK
ncbi:hypothetical protein U1Q18_002534, partial [Sarracenia purpurea var. burkii]